MEFYSNHLSDETRALPINQQINLIERDITELSFDLDEAKTIKRQDRIREEIQKYRARIAKLQELHPVYATLAEAIEAAGADSIKHPGKQCRVSDYLEGYESA
jgi:hypothetical protein